MCALYNRRKQCFMPPHFLGCTVFRFVVCLFFLMYDYLLWLFEGWMGGDWLHLLVLLPISSWPRRCWSFTVVPMNVFPVDMHMNTKTYLLSGILFLNHVRSVKRNPPPPHPLETLGMNHFCASCSFPLAPDVFLNLIVVLYWCICDMWILS